MWLGCGRRASVSLFGGSLPQYTWSLRISDASYRPRTTWSLPQIVSALSKQEPEDGQMNVDDVNGSEADQDEKKDNQMDVDGDVLIDDEGQRHRSTRGFVATDTSTVHQDPLFLSARHPYEEHNIRHDLGCMDVRCRQCKALHWMDERLKQSASSNPVFGLCCNSGKVILRVLRDPPQNLKNLLECDDRQGKDFRENIWKYNRAFAFTSLYVTEDHSVNEGHRGPPVFRIQGELHHRGGPLSPASDCPPSYAQLYFYDPHAALEHRCQQNSGLYRDTLRILQNMLLSHHRYVPMYCHAYEILKHYNPDDDISMSFRVTATHDRRRFNRVVHGSHFRAIFCSFSASFLDHFHCLAEK